MLTDLEIVCEPTKYQCKSNRTICLNRSQRCDGKSDCPNGEDEVDCGQCLSTQFECVQGECIPLEWRCDDHKVNNEKQFHSFTLLFILLVHRIVKMAKMN